MNYLQINNRIFNNWIKLKDFFKQKLEHDTILYKSFALVNSLIYYAARNKISEHKIQLYINSLKPEQELKVIFGGHWSPVDDWLILTENDQNIKKQLKFPDDIVDVIFTEHVIEHVEFIYVIRFMQESLRILKKNGVFRLVCPTIEKLISADLNDANGAQYIKNCLLKVWLDENKALNELDLNGLCESPITFLLNAAFTRHDHKFIWSEELIVKVLKAIGFSEVNKRRIGEGINEEYCIERRRRGLYLGHDWQVDRHSNVIYDPESIVVEAIK
jgi:SAM-dependent methyltransferase